MQPEPSPRILPSSQRRHLENQMREMDDRYNILTQRVVAIDKTLADEFDEEKKLGLRNRRQKLADERDYLADQMIALEVKLQNLGPTEATLRNPESETKPDSVPGLDRDVGERPLGGVLQPALDYQKDHPSAEPSATAPEEWKLRLGVRAWDSELGKQPEATLRDLEEKAKRLVADRDSAYRKECFQNFEELLYGYTAYVEREKEGYPALINGVTEYIKQFNGCQHSEVGKKARDLLNEFTLWLHKLVKDDESGKLYDDLECVCTAAWDFLKGIDPNIEPHAERVWFSRLFKAAETWWPKRPSEPNRLDPLLTLIIETSKSISDQLWAIEVLAFYLERYALLWNSEEKREPYFAYAAVKCHAAATKVARDVGENPEFAAAFSAALLAREAHCYERIDEDMAAKRFRDAANRMAWKERASIVANQYYDTARRLDSSSGSRSQLASGSARRNREPHEATLRSRGRVAIIANEWDEVFADMLVARFDEVEISAVLELSVNVKDLSRRIEGGFVIVGGIRAPTTVDLLQKYCYTVKSSAKGITLEELERMTGPYSDTWKTSLFDKRPVFILGGNNREKTCREVMEFAGANNPDFEEFIRDMRHTA